MVYSEYVKQRVFVYLRLERSYADISCYLSMEGHKASKMGVYKFLKPYQETGTVLRRPVSGHICKSKAYYQWVDDEGRWIHESGASEDVIYTDETTVQNETHMRMCCYKQVRNLGTNLGPSTLWRFTCGLELAIVDTSPFIHSVYPNGHSFMQDNDPKHRSKLAKAYYKKNGISFDFIVYVIVLLIQFYAKVMLVTKGVISKDEGTYRHSTHTGVQIYRYGHLYLPLWVYQLTFMCVCLDIVH